MLGWVIKLHTFQYVSMNFDATVCHFEGFTSKTTNSAVFWGVFLVLQKARLVGSLQRCSRWSGTCRSRCGIKAADFTGRLQEWFRVEKIGKWPKGGTEILVVLDAEGWWDGRRGFQGGWNLTVQTLRNIDEQISIWDKHMELPCLLCRESDRKRCSVAVASTCGSGVRHSVSELWVSWYGGRSHEQWAKWSNAESTPKWP